MRFQPSRTLNESSSLFGLGIWDLAFLGYGLVLLNELLKPFGLESFSFLVTGLIFLVLIKLRVSGRKKIIRDFIIFKIRRLRL